MWDKAPPGDDDVAGCLWSLAALVFIGLTAIAIITTVF